MVLVHIPYMFAFPKNDHKYEWTNHVKTKMVQYRLSKSLILGVIRNPKRTEEGIARETVAVMQSSSTTKKLHEVWVMYQKRQQKKLIISAWRYPGVTIPGKKVVIPDEIIIELDKWIKKENTQ